MTRRESVVRFLSSKSLSLSRRIGQVLLIPFLSVGLLIGLVALVAILAWRTGVVGYRLTRGLADRRSGA